VWAAGASEIARRNVSTPVFVGMLAASTVGIFLIPCFTSCFKLSGRRRRENRRPRRRPLCNRPNIRRGRSKLAEITAKVAGNSILIAGEACAQKRSKQPQAGDRRQRAGNALVSSFNASG